MRHGKRTDNRPVGRWRAHAHAHGCTHGCTHMNTWMHRHTGTRTHTHACTDAHARAHTHGSVCRCFYAFSLHEPFNLFKTCFNCCDVILSCPYMCSHNASRESHTRGGRCKPRLSPVHGAPVGRDPGRRRPEEVQPRAKPRRSQSRLNPPLALSPAALADLQLRILITSTSNGTLR